MKVVFCIPFYTRPTEHVIKALEESIPAIEAAGWEHGLAQHMGSPYISAARADMTRKALDANADVIMYIDYDLSWSPDAIVKILGIDKPVVAGNYRFKMDEVQYMGSLETSLGDGITLDNDRCAKAVHAPAGFLKVTRDALSVFARKHKQLLYGDPLHPSIDLFNHGAIEGTWYGEDYAFCRRWRETGNDMLIATDLNITHHSSDKSYEGNFYNYLMSFT